MKRLILAMSIATIGLTSCQTTSATTPKHYLEDLYRVENAIETNENFFKSTGVRKAIFSAEQEEKLKVGVLSAKSLHGSGKQEEALKLLHKMMGAMKVTHDWYVPPNVGKFILMRVGASTVSADELTGFRKTFYDKFSVNFDTCVTRVTTQMGGTRENADKFCKCQGRVFAQHLTKYEMGIMERITFGNSRAKKPNDEADGMKALMRIMPIRKEKCGM